jgi:hypothetical protein
MVGINVRAGTVSTRRSRVGTNLKKDLLGHIKEISVSLEVCSTAVDRLHQLIEHTTNVEVEIQPEDRCYCDRIHGPTGPRFFSAQGVSWCCRMQAYQISPLVVLFVTAKTHGPFWLFATLRDSIKICHRQKGELRVYIMDDMPAPYEYDGDDNTDDDSEEDQEGNTTGNTTGDTEGDTGGNTEGNTEDDTLWTPERCSAQLKLDFEREVPVTRRMNQRKAIFMTRADCLRAGDLTDFPPEEITRLRLAQDAADARELEDTRRQMVGEV